jgi:hypothetical protein
MGLAPLAASAATVGPIDFSGTSDYSNNNPPTSGLFRDFMAGSGINRGYDVGFTGNTALNFSLNAGSGGASAITLYDTNPTNATPTLFSGGITLSTDVLIGDWHDVNEPGLVAYFNEGPGQGGIALLLYQYHNTDSLLLQKVDQSGILIGGAGNLASVGLPNGSINEADWYRLVLTGAVAGNTLQVTGQVFNHTHNNDPNSSLGSQIGSNLVYTGSLSTLGISSTGEIGLAYRTTDNASASATNFAGVYSENNGEAATVPEPGTLLLMGGALAALWAVRRR